MFTFRSNSCKQNDSLLRIKKILSSRLAMHIGELCMRIGESEEVVRLYLDMLVASGVVERLRPIGYEKDDMDFFRITGSGATVIKTNNEFDNTEKEKKVLIVNDLVTDAV